MVDFSCAECGKRLNSDEALAQHRQSKHATPSPKPAPVWAKVKPYKGKLLALGVLLLLGAGIWSLAGSWNSTQAVSFPPRLSAQAMHIHSNLQISLNGNPVDIPKDIGIGRIHQPLHTHEADNVIHVESSETRDYTLGNFFQVWGKKLSASCVMDYCTGGGKTLSMTVNGAASTEFDGHVLRDGDSIVLNYG